MPRHRPPGDRAASEEPSLPERACPQPIPPSSPRQSMASCWGSLTLRGSLREQPRHDFIPASRQEPHGPSDLMVGRGACGGVPHPCQATLSPLLLRPWQSCAPQNNNNWLPLWRAWRQAAGCVPPGAKGDVTRVCPWGRARETPSDLPLRSVSLAIKCSFLILCWVTAPGQVRCDHFSTFPFLEIISSD